MERGGTWHKGHLVDLVFACKMRLHGDEFVKQSLVMFLASLAGCLCSYLYQVYVGRALGPEGYGVFGSLFAIFYLISIFSSTVQAGAARFISRFNAGDDLDSISAFFCCLMKKSALLGAAGFVIFCLASPIIADFLNIDSKVELVLLGTVILFAFVTPASAGVLQGLQMFYWLALASFLGLAGKLFFGIALVSLGYGVAGAIGALALCALITFLISIYPVSSHLTRRDGDICSLNDLYSYSLPTILIMICLAAPSNLDVILVKHFFPSYEAGLYTAASVMGKIIMFLPGAIATVMFPKAAEMNCLGKSTFNLLNRCLIYTGLLSGSAAAAFALYPQLIVTIFGYSYSDASSITVIYVALMFLFSLIIVIAQYCLATNDLIYTYLLVLFTLLELGLITIIHDSVLQVVEGLLVINLILLILSYAFVVCRRRDHVLTDHNNTRV
ncbi:MAG: oligosaccharide flippase family protein [Methanothrix sp.]